MKGFILAVIVIIAAVIVVGGAAALNVVKDVSDGSVDGSSSVGRIIDKVSSVASSGSSKSSSGDSGKTLLEDVSDVVSEEVKFNSQNGEGYYREVTYKDGGFRQYDVDSGELIGSSYDSDQKNLPSLE